MADYEILQSLLDKMSNLETDLLEIKNNQIDLQEFRKLQSDLDEVKNNQIETRIELYRIDRKISDTYNLALDAWGQNAENKEWLETQHKKA